MPNPKTMGEDAAHRGVVGDRALDHLRRAPLEPFLRDSAVRCSGTEPEHRMPSGFRHELLDRVTGFCVEKRGSHSRVAHVPLQDGSSGRRVDFLGLELLTPFAAAKRQLRRGSDVVDPPHRSVRRDEPPFATSLHQDHRRRSVLTSLPAGGREQVGRLAANAVAEQCGHQRVDSSTGRPEPVAPRHLSIFASAQECVNDKTECSRGPLDHAAHEVLESSSLWQAEPSYEDANLASKPRGRASRTFAASANERLMPIMMRVESTRRTRRVTADLRKA